MEYTVGEQRANREMLIEVLLGDEYTQTRGSLRDETGFCIGGVACDISGLARWKRNKEGIYIYQRQYKFMPAQVKKFYGFQDGTGAYWVGPKRIHYRSLIGYNDKGWNFVDLANLIALEPPGMFWQYDYTMWERD